MNIFHNKIAMKLLNKNIYFFYIEIDKNPLANFQYRSDLNWKQ